MSQRKIQEIEAEMDKVKKTGNIGRMMDLVDEHGYIIDKMHEAIADGDLDRIATLEQLSINITHAQFWKSAILSDQLLVIVYQVNKGANVDKIINFAKPRDVPFKIGGTMFSGNLLIYKWANSWKYVNTLNKRLPFKGNKSDRPKKI